MRITTPLLLAACLSAAGCPGPDGAGGGTIYPPPGPDPVVLYANLRLMAANLTSGNGQDYDGGEGIRIMRGCAPDVVMVQEFAYKANSAADYQEMANLVIYGNAAAAPPAFYFSEGGHSIPNGIISRYAILDAGEWDDTYLADRDFAWARIDVPGATDLWAVSVHIKASSGSADIAKRANEAALLEAYISANVPSSALLVVAGDFNTYSNLASTEPCLGEFDDFLVLSGAYPRDGSGNVFTNASRAAPYDRVLADADLEAFATSTTIGTTSFPYGFVADTRVHSPLSDLAPALATDSAAPNMQHMGVVRDFRIPIGP